MSWRQAFEEPPTRSRCDLYLDGLVSGGIITWLLMMLYEMSERDGDGPLGLVLLVVLVVFLAVVTLFKVVRLRKRGD